MGKKALGTYDIAKICQVTPATIGRWVNDGKLPFFTTGGGHRRVWNRDLVVFLNSHNMPVPRELLANSVLRILIVDDELSVRRSVSRMIQKLGPEIEIHEAKDGFEAGHKTGSLMPSLVILDLKLPGIDGVEVCRMIRKDGNLSKTKILAISGTSSEEAKKQVIKAGADDFLAKPFDSEELIEKVHQLIPAIKV